MRPPVGAAVGLAALGGARPGSGRVRPRLEARSAAELAHRAQQQGGQLLGVAAGEVGGAGRAQPDGDLVRVGGADGDLVRVAQEGGD